MKVLALICRILLGLLFVVFGFNFFLHFIKMPPPPAGSPAMQYMTASFGWLKIVHICEIIGGLLVLLGGTLPLGLCILCPITFNILCFHMLLTGGHGIGPGLFSALLELILIYLYRANFAGVLTAKASPTVL